MKKTFWMSVLALSSIGQTAAVSLRSLLASGKGNVGPIRDNTSSSEAVQLLTVVKKTSQGTLLTLDLMEIDPVDKGVSSVSLRAYKEYLTPKERLVFNQTAIDIALKCFNLKVDRKSDIVAWLDKQNASLIGDVSNDSGPLNVQFVRYSGPEGKTATQLNFYRDQPQPGVAPWTSYCTL